MADYNYLNEKGQVTLVFRGSLTISEVSEIKEIFNKAIAESENILINHDECESFDLSYIQLVISAYRTAKEWRKSLKVISKENDLFKQTLKDVGFKIDEIFLN